MAKDAEGRRAKKKAEKERKKAKKKRRHFDDDEDDLDEDSMRVEEDVRKKGPGDGKHCGVGITRMVLGE